MALSRSEISNLVLELFKDNILGTNVEPFIDFGIDRLNLDRPHINVTDYTVQAGDLPERGGTVFAVPTGFDLARDRIACIEDLNTDGVRSIPALYIFDFELYQTTTDVVKIQVLQTLQAGRKLRISWRSRYTFEDGESNVPDSLARPLTLITAYYYIMAVVARLAQNKKEGGDEIAAITQMTNVRQLGEIYMQEYQALVKELAPSPAGVTPTNIPASRPSRMGRITR